MRTEKDLPYYRLWVKDFDTNENVRVLDLAELGLYISCLNHSWVNDGLPTDPLEIARALKVRPALFIRLWKRVEKCFQLSGDRLVNPRQEKERVKALAKSKQASDAVAERERQRDCTIIGRSSDDQSDDDLRTHAGAVSECVSDSDLDFDFTKKTSLPNSEILPPAGIIRNSFHNFWDRWCALTGRKQRESFACQAWISVVEFATEPFALACLERYGASDEVRRGVVSNPDKWLYAQARDGFKGEWQAVSGTPSKMDRTMEILRQNLAIEGKL